MLDFLLWHKTDIANNDHTRYIVHKTDLQPILQPLGIHFFCVSVCNIYMDFSLHTQPSFTPLLVMF